MQSESAKTLIHKKQSFEKALLKIISEFEDDTGLTVTELNILRPDAVGGSAPISHIRTTVDVITY
jgi:hypothetical protein